MIAALESMRVHDTEVRGGEVRVFQEEERDPVKICGGGGMMFWPVGIEFASFPSTGDNSSTTDVDAMDHDAPSPAESNNITITDPTLQESQLAASTFSVTVTESGGVIQMTKPGGEVVDAVELLKCVDKAVDTVRGVHKTVKEALEKEKEKRGEGRGVEAVLRSENER